MSVAHVGRRALRAGLTLVEMLVAMTCTILLMFAITQTFQNIGEISAKGRAAIELSTQLRGVQHRLHKDFESLTVPVRPWPEAGAGEGYFEIIEGTNRYDGQTVGSVNDLYGDFDDIWCMTIRSTGEPFVGRFNGAMIQSQLAEVIWFTSYIDRASPADGFTLGEDRVNLHRRVLLIRPDLNGANGQLTGYTDAQIISFLQENDVSVRRTGGNIAANSLADLTQRENRFGHFGNFPSAISVTNGFLSNDPDNPAASLVLGGDRTGEDVMLSNVLSADIRVFDRTAIVRQSGDGTQGLSPGDPGYAAATTTIGYGAYVDLNYVRYVTGAASEFSAAPVNGMASPVYDTWSYWYEHDGVNQDGDTAGMAQLIDEAENGLDDDNNNGVDDVGERETSPPYPVPLRGVQVRLRVLEPETSQVRQATVVQDFIPE